MSSLRSVWASLLSATLAFTLVNGAGCSTGAVGIGACREIETARCRASVPCGVVKEKDVEACERFYRDQCLHGLSTAEPPSSEVSECVTVIEAAAQCATDAGSAKVELEDCDPFVTTPRVVRLVTACDVVAHPERADECAFLRPVPEPPDAVGGAPNEPVDPGTAGHPAGGAPAGGAPVE